MVRRIEAELRVWWLKNSLKLIGHHPVLYGIYLPILVNTKLDG